MFGQNREQLRRFYQHTWEKRQAGTQLEGLELLVAQVVEQHPEYHALLSDAQSLHQDFTVEDGQTNPFLHMGMHISLGEALAADRPVGARTLYNQIALKTGDAHEAEHRMMECLGVILWEAQRSAKPPDEQAFLECLRKLAGLPR